MIEGIGTTISFKRAEDGGLILVAKDAQNVNIEGVGIISGSAELRITNTDKDTDATVYEYNHEGDSENNLELADGGAGMYNIKGTNVNVTSATGGSERTIQIDAEAANIDLRNAGGRQSVYMSSVSTKNNVQLGCGNDVYIDEGKFNAVTGTSGNNVLQSTQNSFGSIMTGGSGDDTFDIAGSYGIYYGATGNDNFNLGGFFGETADSSYRNVLIGGNGNNNVVDRGGYNMYIGGTGADSYSGLGYNGIAYLGKSNSNSATIGQSAERTYIFADTELTTSSGKHYKLADVMAKYGWTLDEFLNEYSQVSEKDKRNLANSGMVTGDILKVLKSYFAELLEREENVA